MNKRYIYQIVILFAVILLFGELGFNLFRKDDWFAILSKIENVRPSIRTGPGVIVYILLSFGIYIYVLPFIRPTHIHQDILFYSTIFGTVVYGIMQFTNYKFFEQWTLSNACLDTLWGAILVILSTYSTVYITRIIR